MTMRRRAFLAAGLAGGVLTADLRAREPARKLTRDELPTPALLVNLDDFEANLRTMASHCKKAGCAFRPHAKTHKCPEVARLQTASGAVGVCVATVAEAEAMAAAGIKGILLTSPIVEPLKVARMVALPRNKGAVLLAVGDPKEADLLAGAAADAKVVMDVLIDVDVGDRRTGVSPGKPALLLAERVAKWPSLRLRGVQAYSGSSSHTVGFENRAKASRTAMTLAVETRELLTKAGLDAPILSGGSTGTYNIDSAMPGVTELQVGSYVFMDVDYRQIGGKDGETYADFRPSLTVLTTAISAARPGRVTVDAGTKAFATDVSFKPEAVGQAGLTYTRAGDEFGTLTATSGAKLPRLGDRLEFIVPHCDPTVNLYDRIYAMRGERVEAIWPVLARREASA